MAILCLPGSLWAQSYDNPGPGQQPVSSHPSDFKPLGIRAGAFMLHPGVELVAEFNDNILSGFETEISDTIFHIRPYITAQSNWSRHSLNVRLAADFARFNDFGIRDYEDYFFLINGRVDVRNQSNFNYDLNYLDLHEDLNDRSAQQGVSPTTYSLFGGGLGYDHSFNRLTAGLRYDLHELDFDNNTSADDEIIDNQDRDRDESSLLLRLGYQFQTDKQVFVSAAYNKIDYSEEFDRNGLSRSSDGFNVNGGLALSITGVLSGDVFVSYHEQDFDDPLLRDVSGWAGGMGLNWQPTTLTSIQARVSSGVEETTAQSSSGYLRRTYSLRVDHELLRNLQIIGQASYSDNDYQLIDNAPLDARESDQLWSAGIGVTYFFNRRVYLSATYDYNDFSTNVPNDDYTTNRFWLVLGLER